MWNVPQSWIINSRTGMHPLQVGKTMENPYSYGHLLVKTGYYTGKRNIL